MKKNIYSEATAVKSTNMYYNPISKKNMKLTVSNQKNYYVALNKLKYYIPDPKAPIQKIVIDYYRGIIELYSNATTGKPSPDEVKEFFTKNFGNNVKPYGTNLARFKYTEIEDIAAAIGKIIEAPKETIQTIPQTPGANQMASAAPNATPITSSYEQPFSKNFKYFLEQYSHIISEENVNLPGVGDIEVPNSRTKFFEIENIAIRVRNTNTAYFYNLDTKELFTVDNNGKPQPIDIKELPKLLGVTPTSGGTNQMTTQQTPGSQQTGAAQTETGIKEKITAALKTVGRDPKLLENVFNSIKNTATALQDKAIEVIKSTGITNIVDGITLGDKAKEITTGAGVKLDPKKVNYGIMDPKDLTKIIITTSVPTNVNNYIKFDTNGKATFIIKTPKNDSYDFIPKISKLGTFFEASGDIINKDIFNIINEAEEAVNVDFKYVYDIKKDRMVIEFTGQPDIKEKEIGTGWNFWNNFTNRIRFKSKAIEIEDLISQIKATETAPETMRALTDLFNKFDGRGDIVTSSEASGDIEERQIKKAIYDVILKRDKEKQDIDAGLLLALNKRMNSEFNIELDMDPTFKKYFDEKTKENIRDKGAAGEIANSVGATEQAGQYTKLIQIIYGGIGGTDRALELETKVKELMKDPDTNAKSIINITKAYLDEIPPKNWGKIVLEYRKAGANLPFPAEKAANDGSFIWEFKKLINKKLLGSFEALIEITLPKIRKAIGDGTGIDLEKYYRMRIRNEFSYFKDADLKDKESDYTKIFNEIVAEMKKGKYLDMQLLTAVFNGTNVNEALLDFFSRVFKKNEKLNEKLRKAFVVGDTAQEDKASSMDDNELLKKGGIFIGANDNWKRRAFTHEAILRFEETGKIDQDDVRRISDFTGTTPDFIRRKLFDKKSDVFRKKLKKLLEDNGLTKESLMGNKEGEEAATKKSKKEETVQTNTNPVIEKIIKKYKNGKILTDADDKARLLEELNNFNASLEVDRRFISKVLEIKKDEYNLAMEGVYTLINTFNKTPKELKGEKKTEEKKAEVKKTEENKKEETGFKYINKKNGEIKLKKIGDRIKAIQEPSPRSRINDLIRRMGSAEEANKITDDDIAFIKQTLNIDDAEYKAILAAPNKSSLLDKTKLGLSLNDSYQPKNDLESFIFTEYFNIEGKLKK